MCGIAGIIRQDLDDALRLENVGVMLDRLTHRGPDESGINTLGAATFGAARLSIIDRALGHQPMNATYAGHRTMLAYNGEVYNFRELKGQLEAAGFTFHTNCDTEVVLAAHLIWGDEAPLRLDGMFAYALWEEASTRLTLVRDRLGIKPLFYVLSGNSIRFASEPKALRQGSGRERLDPLALLEFLTHGSAFASGYTTGSRSFYTGIHTLQPGEILTWTAGESRRRQYWRVEQEFGEYPGTIHDAEAEIGAAVQDSVRAMLVGEVPLGTALSGGLDSSWMTAEAARALGTITSSCITFRPDHADPDALHAQLVSNFLNKECSGIHRLRFAEVPLEHYLDDLDPLVRAFDEPHWELRQLGMFSNYRSLKESGCTIVLTGEGADELFFGYYQRFPGFRHPVVRSPEDWLSHWRPRAVWSQRLLRPAFESGRLPQNAVDWVMEEAVDHYYRPVFADTHDYLRAVQCWYIATFLRWLLVVNDRCSMAHSLEGRFPYLSNRLLSLALRMAPKWNTTQDGVMCEKVLFRRAASMRLPPEIWKYRAKAPLPVPQDFRYHRMIAERLVKEIESADKTVWEWLDRHAVSEIAQTLLARIEQASRLGDQAGEFLTGYIPLDEPLQPRTAQAFGILTFLRWWELC